MNRRMCIASSSSIGFRGTWPRRARAVGASEAADSAAQDSRDPGRNPGRN